MKKSHITVTYKHFLTNKNLESNQGHINYDVSLPLEKNSKIKS